MLALIIGFIAGYFVGKHRETVATKVKEFMKYMGWS